MSGRRTRGRPSRRGMSTSARRAEDGAPPSPPSPVADAPRSVRRWRRALRSSPGAPPARVQSRTNPRSHNNATMNFSTGKNWTRALTGIPYRADPSACPRKDPWWNEARVLAVSGPHACADRVKYQLESPLFHPRSSHRLYTHRQHPQMMYADKQKVQKKAEGEGERWSTLLCL
jgi:hypothetical protein